MSCSHRDDVGAYVLGALDVDEHRIFRSHLQTCADCRRSVEELQGVVDVLPVSAPPLQAPAALKDRIMLVVNAEAELLAAAGPESDRPPAPAAAAVAAPRERRRRRGWLGSGLRPALVLGLSLVLLAIGVGAGALLGGGDDGAQTRTVVASAPKGTDATVTVRDGRAVLRLADMPAPPRGKVYQVWLVGPSGRPQPSHTLFDVRGDGRANVEIDEPVDGVDQVLVTPEPAGGSDVPTGLPPILAAKLA